MSLSTETPASWRDLLGTRHLGIAVVMAGGVLVGAINIYLAAGLLPTIVADIGGGDFYAWSMTGYLVTMVIASMLVSRVLGRWGNVGAYLLGFGVFIAGSLACAISPTMPALLAGRAVQGLGAGLLSGLGFAVIRSALPQRLWIRGSALMSAMYGVGNFVGPALGGLFAQFGAWRLAFVLMAAIAAGCGLIVLRAMPAGDRTNDRTPVPVLSLLLATAATAAISVAGILPTTAAKATAVAAAIVLAIGFVVQERHGQVQVFPRTTYRPGSPLKWIYLTLGLLTFAVAVESLLPLFAQRMGGLAPAVAGFLAAAISLGWSVTQLGSASAAGKRTIRRLCLLGPTLLIIGLVVQGFLQREDTPVWLIAVWIPVLFIAGAGIGLAYPHLSVAAMASGEDPNEGKRAAAGIATVTTMSIAFGTAIAGVLINLGEPSILASARYLLFGFAAISVLGVVTVRLAIRPSEPLRQLRDHQRTHATTSAD